MNSLIKKSLHAVLLLVVLLGIAFFTRVPALYFSGTYGLHAVLVAPFVACIASWYLRRYRDMLPLFVALCLEAVFLSMMQPAMAFGIAVPALVAAGIWVLAQEFTPSISACIAGAFVGALSYPCLIGASLLTGGLMAIDVSKFVLLFILSCGFGYLGALVGFTVGGRCAPEPPEKPSL